MCRRVLFFVALSLLVPSLAQAWHSSGHMAIARIAWKQLSDAERVYYANLLKKHPHYEAFLAADRPTDVPEVEWAFMRAAVWGDWVRGPYTGGPLTAEQKTIKNQFDRPAWHYVNLPYIHPDDAGKYDAEKIRKEILEPELDKKGQPLNVLAALKYNKDRLKAAETSDADRAVALTWIMHLVGDIHQPLHGTSLIWSAAGFEPLHGDLGGNRLAIRPKPGAKAQKLHFYWDALLFPGDPGFKAVDPVVADLLNDPELKPEKFPEIGAEFLTWAEESRDLAISTVYRDGGEFIKAKALPAGRVDLDTLDVPAVSEAYAKAANALARKRMALAGYRLANQLKQAAQKN
jgi:hypothetical protein